MSTKPSDVVFAEWFGKLPGRLYRDAERRGIYRALRGRAVRTAVQIGNVLQLLDLASCDPLPGAAHVLVGAVRQQPGDICAQPHDLPFYSDCIDLLILPHVLEMHPRPHAVLREAHRVLAPEGHILITGFSPVSLFGAAHLALRHRRNPPWNARLLSVGRVTDWLALLGFERVGTLSDPLPRPWLAPAALAYSFAGAVAGSYVLLGRKRVFGLRPIVSRWRPRRLAVVGGLAEPSTRTAARPKASSRKAP